MTYSPDLFTSKNSADVAYHIARHVDTLVTPNVRHFLVWQTIKIFVGERCLINRVDFVFLCFPPSRPDISI